MPGGSGPFPLIAAEATLRLGLAKPWEVAAALQAVWDAPGNGVTFEAEITRIAKLSEADVARIRADAARTLAAAGGDAVRALGGSGASLAALRSIGGAGRAGAGRATGALDDRTSASLRTVQASRYVEFHPAGAGGMGVVYWALDTEMNRQVAFKIVRPDAVSPVQGPPPTTPDEATPPPRDTPDSVAFDELRSRFLQEAWVTGGLEHPGIVPVYELGQTAEGVPYYTMRFIRGSRTLATALEEARGRPFEERLTLLEPFLKVCDTVAYAHSRGVIHRDLKPANVALGDFGEAVLLDWGIAKLEHHEDGSAARWQARVREYRGATDFQTMATALGTPGYMAPEAALGEVDDVDARSDVYSLGAMLFELLTGRLPFVFSTFLEYATQVTRDDPPRARTLEPAVPEALDALCARCLSRDRQARPADVAGVARAIRAWQTSSAAEREVASHLRDARAAIEAAESLTGADRLVQADRAAAGLARVAALDADNADAAALSRSLSAIRERGQAERDAASRRRVLVRGGIAALVVALLAAALVARVLDEKRREADAAREDAVTARSAAETARADTQAALDEVLRLADTKRARDLLAEADGLWPATNEKAPAMAEWVGRARRLVEKREEHRDSLARLRRRALPYDEAAKRRDHGGAFDRIGAIDARLAALAAEQSGPAGADAEDRRGRNEKEVAALTLERTALQAEVEKPGSYRFTSSADDWRHQVLSDLLVDLGRLSDPADAAQGVLAAVVRRHEFVSTLAKASLEDHAAAWSTTIEAIASSPKYAGLRIRPQLGLVPLGPDPDCGLFEFAHLGSGPVPARDAATQRLVLPDDGFAVILVLVPGGTFHKGAQKHDPQGPNYDPQAEPPEGPPWPVTLSPYFLAKHECTQAQWMALTGGENPSNYKPGDVYGGQHVSGRNPVEHVSWEDGSKWLPRFGLALPTEAQWEHACRAGTVTPWVAGEKSSSLQGTANVADAFAKRSGASPHWRFSEEIDDGHFVHAPVGSFAANAFGLHDMLGNVSEWCQDTALLWTAAPPKDPVATGPGERVARGGSWSERAVRARAASRTNAPPTVRLNILGLRPARSVITE